MPCVTTGDLYSWTFTESGPSPLSCIHITKTLRDSAETYSADCDTSDTACGYVISSSDLVDKDYVTQCQRSQ